MKKIKACFILSMVLSSLVANPLSAYSEAIIYPTAYDCEGKDVRVRFFHDWVEEASVLEPALLSIVNTNNGVEAVHSEKVGASSSKIGIIVYSLEASDSMTHSLIIPRIHLASVREIRVFNSVLIRTDVNTLENLYTKLRCIAKIAPRGHDEL